MTTSSSHRIMVDRLRCRTQGLASHSTMSGIGLILAEFPAMR
jgi:hypothetical protein